MNLCGTPGLGSLLAGRTAEGVLQLLLSVGGFALVAVWFVGVLTHYYGMMFGGDGGGDQPSHGALALVGAGMFAAAWLWSLVTSLQLLRKPSRPPPIFDAGLPK